MNDQSRTFNNSVIINEIDRPFGTPAGSDIFYNSIKFLSRLVMLLEPAYKIFKSQIVIEAAHVDLIFELTTFPPPFSHNETGDLNLSGSISQL